MKKSKKVEITCAFCGIPFLIFPSRLGVTKNCSPECGHKGKRKDRIFRTCEWCSKSFDIKRSTAKYRPAKYCSNECYYDFRNSKHPTLMESEGYLVYYWPRNPLANKAGKVYEHHLVLWTESGYSPQVRKRIKSKGWTIHHINGKRDDNRTENLEWRMRGKHPVGVGIEDAIKILRLNGITTL